MAPRTRKEPHESEQGEEFTPVEDLTMLHSINSKVDEIAEQVQSMRGDLAAYNLLGNALAPDPGQERIKPTRRRSQDEMDQALRRLLTGELRPRDDDSPQVMQDAIAEVIALRQLIHDLMQALTSGYQHGLAAIRDMTSR